MNSLAFASLQELKLLLEANKIVPQDLLNLSLQRCKEYNKQLGAVLEVFSPESIVEASNEKGLLAGIPGLLKDNISQQSRGLTCGSKILENFVSTYDATTSRRLKEAGGYLIGRTNMDEFAMGSSNETSAYYPARNPWDPKRVPGGSSGGSAAAVAAGLTSWALGSDTGGSVRQPAALCGIVGMKPTYGLVSRYGLVAYGSSLDQIGVLTRDVYGNALVFSSIAGHDIKDSSSLFVSKKNYTEKLNGTIPEGLKIGIIDNALETEGIDPEISSAIQDATHELEKLGATIKHISLPSLDYAPAAYFIISRAEAASNLARFDGVRYGLRNKKTNTLSRMYTDTRHDGFGSEVKSRIMVGNYVLSAGHASDYYTNAKMVQRLIRHEFFKAYKDVDLLIMPTHPEPAFKLGAFDLDKLTMDLQDYYTCPVNLAGIPAISMPCGFTKEKLPIGFQLWGPHLSEGLLYQVAYAYEQATPWHSEHPPLFT